MTYSTNLLSKIIHSVFTAQDHRKYILAIINERFVKQVDELIENIFEYKKQGKNWVQIINAHYEKSEDKKKIAWLAGLNQKTILNMSGSTSKRICFEVGKDNVNAFETLLQTIETKYLISIDIRCKNESIRLDETESMIFINAVSSMKSSIRGGAWSEVGKKTENSILLTLFKHLEIPEDNFILITKDIQKKIDSVRETDGILIDRDKRLYKIELKLLGIGNPEVADEGLARDIQLFLVDDLTGMMVNQFKKKGIDVILFKRNKVFEEMYEFCKHNNIPVKKPESKIRFEKIYKIINDAQEKSPDLDLLRKLKSL